MQSPTTLMQQKAVIHSKIRTKPGLNKGQNRILQGLNLNYTQIKQQLNLGRIRTKQRLHQD